VWCGLAVEPLRGEALTPLLDDVRRGTSVLHHVEYTAARGRKWSDDAKSQKERGFSTL